LRIDKFLKVSRLIKRRSVAKEICDAGRISINGRVAKAGTIVAVGDEVTVRYGQQIVTVRVQQLPLTATKADAALLYEIIASTQANQNTVTALDD